MQRDGVNSMPKIEKVTVENQVPELTRKMSDIADSTIEGTKKAYGQAKALGGAALDAVTVDPDKVKEGIGEAWKKWTTKKTPPTEVK
jgi:hypothetical protein